MNLLFVKGEIFCQESRCFVPKPRPKLTQSRPGWKIFVAVFAGKVLFCLLPWPAFLLCPRKVRAAKDLKIIPFLSCCLNFRKIQTVFIICFQKNHSAGRFPVSVCCGNVYGIFKCCIWFQSIFVPIHQIVSSDQGLILSSEIKLPGKKMSLSFSLKNDK